MATKALDLFHAYIAGKLPRDGGYIVSSFFDASSTYSRYEVVAFNSLKGVALIEEGLRFQGDGNKLFVLVEPPFYPRRLEEPVNRDRAEAIPHRFAELETFTAKDETKVMVSKAPVTTHSFFTVLRPTGLNFAFVFYMLPEVIETLRCFFMQSLNKEAAVPQVDAKHAAESVIVGLKKLTVRES